MDEDDIPCVGICLPDPDSAYCLGCGRRSAPFPESPAKPEVPPPVSPQPMPPDTAPQ